MYELGVLKTKTPETHKIPKTLKLENNDLPYFGGLRNYDQSVPMRLKVER